MTTAGVGMVQRVAHTSPTITRTSETVRVDLAPLARRRMSERQSNDLRVGLLLIAAAGVPDVYFDGHPAADPDSVDSLMDRVAIMAAREDIDDLPVAPR